MPHAFDPDQPAPRRRKQLQRRQPKPDYEDGEEAPRRAPHHPPKRKGGIGSLFLRLGIAVGLIALAAVGVTMLVYWHLAKDFDLTQLGAMPERTVVMDRNGELIAKLHGQNRVIVPLSEVSPNFVKALLSREDSRFYQHGGVDYVGVLRAAMRNVKERRVVQGASTITMQLARNSFPGLDEKTLHRKALEIMLSRRIESQLTKDKILEHYVNRIFFGNQIFGIQQAAKAYFGKDAKALSPGEGALLAGIIRGPSKFSPFSNWEGALLQRNDVLERMIAANEITPAQRDLIKAEPIMLTASPVFKGQGDWIMDAVRHDLDLILAEEEREDGGLKVYTTFDVELQKVALAALEKQASTVENTKGYARKTKAQFSSSWDGRTEVANMPYLQGAIVLLDNTTGGILAMVGGRDYQQSKYNRASQAERQIGSTIKPFIYAAAMSRGLLPGTLIDDGPIPGGWSPQNSDGSFLGQQPMALGLIRSRNTMTVRVGDQAGLPQVAQVLSDAGIAEKLPNGRQTFIGNIGSSVKSVTSAFSAFPNGGVRRRPFIISRIEDRLGEVVYATPVLDVPVFEPGIAQLTDRLLHHVMDHGTATAARSQHGYKTPAGGKTGTTNDYKDAWFIGYTQAITCGVWMGCDTPETIVSGGYGGRLALPIWAEIMKTAEKKGWLMEPAQHMAEQRVRLCRNTGLVSTPGCEAQGLGYDDDLPLSLLPQHYCQFHNGAPQAPPPSYGRQRQPPQQEPGLLERLRGWFQ
jgi:penicillin-binding protein 1A